MRKLSLMPSPPPSPMRHPPWRGRGSPPAILIFILFDRVTRENMLNQANLYGVRF